MQNHGDYEVLLFKILNNARDFEALSAIDQISLKMVKLSSNAKNLSGAVFQGRSKSVGIEITALKIGFAQGYFSFQEDFSGDTA